MNATPGEIFGSLLKLLIKWSFGKASEEAVVEGIRSAERMLRDFNTGD